MSITSNALLIVTVTGFFVLPAAALLDAFITGTDRFRAADQNKWVLMGLLAGSLVFLPAAPVVGGYYWIVARPRIRHLSPAVIG